MKICQLENSIEGDDLVRVICYPHDQEIVLYEDPYGDMPLKYATMRFSCLSTHEGKVTDLEFIVPSYEVR